VKAPRFWSRPPEAPGPLAAALAPAGALYAAAVARRIARAEPAGVGRAVFCVGNASLGGVGKTPFALALMRILQGRHVDAAFLSRGYGGREAGPLLVDPERHEAVLVGDEPLLLAREAATCVSRDRVAGARLLASRGVQAIIMDDGFQNPDLAKDLSFLLVDGETGFGNGRVFPAGPLREPPDAAAARADALVIVSSGPDADVRADVEALDFEGPRLRAWLSPDAADPTARVFAFAGIGRPEKFFATLERAGVEVAGRQAFPDHRPYEAADVARLKARAADLGAAPITTEKDAARLGSLWPDVPVLPVRLVVDDPARLASLVERGLGRRAPSPGM